MRILITEDALINQEIAHSLLKEMGYDADVANNGAEAVDLFDDAHFDVILMDMQMPVLDGYAATRSLRETGYDGVIIALTAHAMAQDREKCLNAGCDDYARKPIERPRLIATIQSHLARPAATARAS